MGVVGDLGEFHFVEGCDLVGLGGIVVVAVADFFDPVSAEHLHATGAGFRGDGDEAGSSPGEQRTEVHLGMEHVFLAGVAIVPKSFGGIEAGGEAVVSGADDAVGVVDGDRADFSVGIFGTQ